MEKIRVFLHNALNFPNLLMAKWLRSRGWVAFYLEEEARTCNAACWLELYERGEGRTPPVKLPVMNATEALYGFAGWMTSFKEPVTFSQHHHAAIAAVLVGEFCEANNLPEPTPNWPKNFTWPETRNTSLRDTIHIAPEETNGEDN